MRRLTKPDKHIQSIKFNTYVTPDENEPPTVYADRVGQWYATLIPAENKKDLGQYLTPIEVATFMAKLLKPIGHPSLRILDPGAGAGILSCALCEVLAERQPRLQEIILETYEVDKHLASYLEVCLAYTKKKLQTRGITLKFAVNTTDFIMTHAAVLNKSHNWDPDRQYTLDRFDIIICNPPYFKIPKSDSRAQAAAAIVHGQPNIYALFMAISAELLKNDGIFICITPRSYATGSYFRLFRERFFAIMKPESIHLFDSRQDTFSRDAVLQENVILVARRSDDWTKQDHHKEGIVKVSSSIGINDLSQRNKRLVPLTDVLDGIGKNIILRIPVSEEDDYAVNIVLSWSGKLHSYDLEISTGPVVPFRAIPFLTRDSSISHTLAPLLWIQHVKTMRIEWPNEIVDKEQYIIANDASGRTPLSGEVGVN